MTGACQEHRAPDLRVESLAAHCHCKEHGDEAISHHHDSFSIRRVFS